MVKHLKISICGRIYSNKTLIKSTYCKPHMCKGKEKFSSPHPYNLHRNTVFSFLLHRPSYTHSLHHHQTYTILNFHHYAYNTVQSKQENFKLQEQRINPDLTFLGNFVKKSPCHLINTHINPCVMFLGLRMSSFSFGHLP